MYRNITRALSTATSASSHAPWFVDKTPLHRQLPPHLPASNEPYPLPAGIPSAIRELHAALKSSPHLEPSELLVCEPIPTPPGPPLPDAMPRGRRQRGRTYVGEGILSGLTGNIWNWIVVAQVGVIILCYLHQLTCIQVKEGTEGRGAIEAVVRVVRKSVI